MSRKPAVVHPAQFDKHEKSHLTKSIVGKYEAISLVVLRGKESWLVRENHATIKLDSRVTSRGMKTYSESRIELQNVQLLKKMKNVEEK